jgi:hypothetical protein
MLEAVRRWLVGREAERLALLCAAAERHAASAAHSAAQAVAAALAAGEAAGRRGVGDGRGGGLDSDLETLDPHTAYTARTGRH